MLLSKIADTKMAHLYRISWTLMHWILLICSEDCEQENWGLTLVYSKSIRQSIDEREAISQRAN